jgi:hypothetical protein
VNGRKAVFFDVRTGAGLTEAQQISRRDCGIVRIHPPIERVFNFRAPRSLSAVGGDQQAKAGPGDATVMLTAIKDVATLIGLILALAAVISMPGLATRPVQALEWIQIGACSEVDMLATAIGETPANCPGP